MAEEPPLSAHRLAVRAQARRDPTLRGSGAQTSPHKIAGGSTQPDSSQVAGARGCAPHAAACVTWWLPHCARWPLNAAAPAPASAPCRPRPPRRLCSVWPALCARPSTCTPSRCGVGRQDGVRPLLPSVCLNCCRCLASVDRTLGLQSHGSVAWGQPGAGRCGHGRRSSSCSDTQHSSWATASRRPRALHMAALESSSSSTHTDSSAPGHPSISIDTSCAHHAVLAPAPNLQRCKHFEIGGDKKVRRSSCVVLFRATQAVCGACTLAALIPFLAVSADPSYLPAVVSLAGEGPVLSALHLCMSRASRPLAPLLGACCSAAEAPRLAACTPCGLFTDVKWN